MKIREATFADVAAITQLFYETVTSINIRDYDEQQIKIWASSAENLRFWQEQIEQQYFIVVENTDCFLGFASLTTEGYLDFLYVHKNHQNQGIASILLDAIFVELQRLQLSQIWTDASLTARPFFLSKGFLIDKVYTKIREGVAFENSIMVKKTK